MRHIVFSLTLITLVVGTAAGAFAAAPSTLLGDAMASAGIPDTVLEPAALVLMGLALRMLAHSFGKKRSDVLVGTELLRPVSAQVIPFSARKSESRVLIAAPAIHGVSRPATGSLGR